MLGWFFSRMSQLDTLEGVHEAGNGDFLWAVHEQMHVVVFAVDFTRCNSKSKHTLAKMVCRLCRICAVKPLHRYFFTKAA